MALVSYGLQRALSKGARWEMWRATRAGARGTVLVKFATGGQPSAVTTVRLHREFEILQGLACDGVARVLELDRDGPEAVLLLQDSGADGSLEELPRDGPLPLARFFALAIGMANAVGNVHQSGVYHGALRPEHVLIGAGDAVVLTGFDRATRIPQEQFAFEGAARLGPEDLPFLSPEQTGRVNRPVDYRTDLYSLGVIFYLLLTGRHPYQAEDTVGWMHAHVALTPPSVREQRPEATVALEAIIMRALAKAPEARYQNAYSLVADLEAAAALGDQSSTARFETSANDRTGSFSLSPRLYGRKHEVDVLTNAFARVAEGERHLVLVAGFSGIGKTALVNETHRQLTERRGSFVSGKFDQFQRSTPYSAVRQAFGELILQLVERDDRRRALSAERLREALGAQLGVIAEVLPELRLLVGDVPAPPPLAVGDAQDRFRLAFRRFVSALARPEHPLVVFFDDLQWADNAGLKTIEELVGADEISHLLLIGAYRDNEVDTGHPLLAAIQRMQEANQPVTSLVLKPLQREHLAALISDSFASSRSASESLAHRVWTKTGGNPFFARQFLRSLALDEVLVFDFKANTWRWELDRVDELDVTDNVVDLMVRQLGRLHARTVAVLRVAACVSNTFDLATLASLTDSPAHEIDRDLFRAAATGLVAPIEGREWTELGSEGADLVDANAHRIVYRFRHDRIQQAAYSLLTPQELPALHLRLGWALSADKGSDDRVFEAVAHFGAARELLTDTNERSQVAELFLRAARRASASMAYAAAAGYCETAIELAGGERSWEQMPALARDVFRLRGECESLVGRLDEAEQTYRVVLERCESRLDRVEVLTLMMEMYVTQGRLAEALRALIDGLALFEVELTPDNVHTVALQAADRVAAARRGRTAGEIVSAPETTDRQVLALLDLLGRSIDTAYMVGRDWVVAVTSVAVSTALEKGVAVSASMVFSTYGLVDAEPNTADGYRRRAEYGVIGAAIAARFGALDWVSRSNVSNPQHYDQTFWEAVSAFEKAGQAGWDSSAVTWGAYAEVRRLFMMLAAGCDLDRLSRERIERQSRIDRANRMVSSVCCDAIRQLVRGLRDETETPWSLGGDLRTQSELEQRVAMFGPWAMCKWYASQQMLAGLFGEHKEARRAAAMGAPVRHAMLGMSHEHLHYLFAALAAASLFVSSDANERLQLKAELDEARAFFEGRVDVNPDFEPSALLTLGAHAAVFGSRGDALDCCNRAVVAAQRCRQTFVEALANERAGELAEASEHQALAGFYFSQALAAYRRWGAIAKIRQLDAQGRVDPTGPSTAAGTVPEQLSRADVESVLKAVRVISGELRFDDLVRRLMAVLLENGSAQRGLLTLVRGDRLWLEAESSAGSDGFHTALVRKQLPESETARPILERVRHTGKPILIDDFSRDDRVKWANWPESTRPCSALCLPISRKGSVVGAVYLENQQTTHGFVVGTRSVLALLVGQVATALENAQLYRDLSDEVSDRLRAEDAMRVERDYTARIIETSPIVVCGIQVDGTTAFINFAGEKLTGYRSDEIVGKPWWDTVHPNEDEQVRQLRKQLDEHGQIRDFELAVTDREGNVRIVQWSCVRHLGDDGRVLHTVCFGRDVTQVRKAQREQAEFEDALQASQRLETVGTLAAGIAHDFNNMLVPILGYAELLTEEVAGNEVANSYVEDLVAATEKASDVVAQLMTASRPRDALDEVASVPEITKSVCALLAASLASNIEVRCQLDPNCPPVIADQGRLHQALLNLGTNAGQAMTPEGGELVFEVAHRAVDDQEARSVTNLQPGPAVVVRVVDTGPGMTAEIRARIFEPFFTTKGHSAGSGLGLWMVHGVVERCGGSISVDSVPGGGTAFTLYLPAGPRDAVASLAPMPADAPFRGRERVMVVDDDEAVVRVADTALTRFGYCVTAFTDPEEALAAVVAAPHDFDAVITDLNMPKMGGSELAAAVRAARPDLPIILATGAAHSIGPAHLAELGVDHLIRKPLTGKMFGAAIRHVLANVSATKEDPNH